MLLFRSQARSRSQSRTVIPSMPKRWGVLENTYREEIDAMLDLGMTVDQVAAYYGVGVGELTEFRAAGCAPIYH